MQRVGDWVKRVGVGCSRRAWVQFKGRVRVKVDLEGHIARKLDGCWALG